MELAARFEWSSVLKFDDDFRHLQALYNFPWLYDAYHLHTTLLKPKNTSYSLAASEQKRKSQAQGQNRFANSAVAQYARDGWPICRNFNRQRGCQKIGGKACGLPHFNYQHDFSVAPSGKTAPH